MHTSPHRIHLESSHWISRKHSCTQGRGSRNSPQHPSRRWQKKLEKIGNVEEDGTRVMIPLPDDASSPSAQALNDRTTGTTTGAYFWHHRRAPPAPNENKQSASACTRKSTCRPLEIPSSWKILDGIQGRRARPSGRLENSRSTTADGKLLSKTLIWFYSASILLSCDAERTSLQSSLLKF